MSERPMNDVEWPKDEDAPSNPWEIDDEADPMDDEEYPYDYDTWIDEKDDEWPDDEGEGAGAY